MRSVLFRLCLRVLDLRLYRLYVVFDRFFLLNFDIVVRKGLLNATAVLAVGFGVGTDETLECLFETLGFGSFLDDFLDLFGVVHCLRVMEVYYYLL